MIRIALGFELSSVIGAGCRYFDIPAPSPPVIPAALIVLAMTLGYTSMDRVVSRKEPTKHLCGGPTGLLVATYSPAARKNAHRDQPEGPRVAVEHGS
jgi:XapX domain-containing protein